MIEYNFTFNYETKNDKLKAIEINCSFLCPQKNITWYTRENKERNNRFVLNGVHIQYTKSHLTNLVLLYEKIKQQT